MMNMEIMYAELHYVSLYYNYRNLIIWIDGSEGVQLRTGDMSTWHYGDTFGMWCQIPVDLCNNLEELLVLRYLK